MEKALVGRRKAPWKKLDLLLKMAAFISVFLFKVENREKVTFNSPLNGSGGRSEALETAGGWRACQWWQPKARVPGLAPPPSPPVQPPHWLTQPVVRRMAAACRSKAGCRQAGAGHEVVDGVPGTGGAHSRARFTRMGRGAPHGASVRPIGSCAQPVPGSCPA